MKRNQTKTLAIAAVVGVAIVGSVALGIGGNTRSVDDWHEHGPEKLSAVVARVAGGSWTVDWEAGTDPVVDPDVLWKNGVLMSYPEDSYDAVRSLLNDVGAIDPSKAFGACAGRHNVLKIVPVDRALDDDCRKPSA